VLNIVYRTNFQVLYTQGGNVASHIIQRFGEAGATEMSALIAAGLVLFLLTLLVNFLANYVVTKTVKSGR
jgi:phosphate transport system permease protein